MDCVFGDLIVKSELEWGMLMEGVVGNVVLA